MGQIFIPKTIHQRFVLGLDAVVTVTMMVFSTCLIFYNVQRIQKELRSRLNRIVTLSVDHKEGVKFQVRFRLNKTELESI